MAGLDGTVALETVAAAGAAPVAVGLTGDVAVEAAGTRDDATGADASETLVPIEVGVVAGALGTSAGGAVVGAAGAGAASVDESGVDGGRVGDAGVEVAGIAIPGVGVAGAAPAGAAPGGGDVAGPAPAGAAPGGGDVAGPAPAGAAPVELEPAVAESDPDAGNPEPDPAAPGAFGPEVDDPSVGEEALLVTDAGDPPPGDPEPASVGTGATTSGDADPPVGVAACCAEDVAGLLPATGVADSQASPVGLVIRGPTLASAATASRDVNTNAAREAATTLKMLRRRPRSAQKPPSQVAYVEPPLKTAPIAHATIPPTHPSGIRILIFTGVGGT